MEALAQEAADSGLHAPSQVWDVVQEWPILLLFLAGFALAYWLFVIRPKGKESEGDDTHSDLRALIVKGFADTNQRITEIREDLREHAQEDRDRDERRSGQITRLFETTKEHGEAIARIETTMERRRLLGR